MNWKEITAAYKRHRQNPLLFNHLVPQQPHFRVEIHPTGVFIAETIQKKCRPYAVQECSSFNEACECAANSILHLYHKRSNKTKTFLLTLWPDKITATILSLGSGEGNFPNVVAFINTIKKNPGAPYVELNPNSFCLAYELTGNSRMLKASFDSEPLTSLIKANIPIEYRYGPLAALAVLAHNDIPSEVRFYFHEGNRISYTGLLEHKLCGIYQDNASRLNVDHIGYAQSLNLQSSPVFLIQIASAAISPPKDVDLVDTSELKREYAPPAAWNAAIDATFFPLGMWQDGCKFE